MDKAVMLSIRPEWCALIAFNEKTVEVRKTRPKIEPPFKCFIYCSNPAKHLLYRSAADEEYRLTKNDGRAVLLRKNGHTIFNGCVIGEFICDDTKSEKEFMNGALPRGETCLSDEDLVRYAGYDTPLFYWHISDIVIYDTPRPLSDFGLKRPPQSWCYVKGE